MFFPLNKLSILCLLLVFTACKKHDSDLVDLVATFNTKLPKEYGDYILSACLIEDSFFVFVLEVPEEQEVGFEYLNDESLKLALINGSKSTKNLFFLILNKGYSPKYRYNNSKGVEIKTLVITKSDFKKYDMSKI